MKSRVMFLTAIITLVFIFVFLHITKNKKINLNSKKEVIIENVNPKEALYTQSKNLHG